MNKLKNLVKMSADEYNEMVQNGSVDIGGTLVSFDVGNLCLVPEEPIVIDTTLANAGQAADAAAVGAALANKYNVVEGIEISNIDRWVQAPTIRTNLVEVRENSRHINVNTYGITFSPEGTHSAVFTFPDISAEDDLISYDILTEKNGYKKVDGVSIVDQQVDTFSSDSTFTRIYPSDGLLVVTNNDGAWFSTHSIGYSGEGVGCNLHFPVGDTIDGEGVVGTIATEEYVQENAGGGKLYWNEVAFRIGSYDGDAALSFSFLATKPVTSHNDLFSIIGLTDVAYQRGYPCSGIRLLDDGSYVSFTEILGLGGENDTVITFGGTDMQGDAIVLTDYFFDYTYKKM